MDLTCSKLHFSKIKRDKWHIYFATNSPNRSNWTRMACFKITGIKQKSFKSHYKVNKNFKLPSCSLWSYPFQVLLKCSYWFIYHQEVVNKSTRLVWTKMFSTKKYRPMYLIRCKLFKRLTLVFSSQLWDWSRQKREEREQCRTLGEINGRHLWYPCKNYAYSGKSEFE